MKLELIDNFLILMNEVILVLWVVASLAFLVQNWEARREKVAFAKWKNSQAFLEMCKRILFGGLMILISFPLANTLFLGLSPSNISEFGDVGGGIETVMFFILSGTFYAFSGFWRWMEQPSRLFFLLGFLYPLYVLYGLA
jgi:hypothetical protein